MFFFDLNKTTEERENREMKSRDIFNFDVNTALFYCARIGIYN